MGGRIFDHHYRKHLRWEHKRKRSQTTRLQEDETMQQYNTIWLSAKEYFDQKSDAAISLPPESAEKSLSMAASGLLAQHQIDPTSNMSPDQVRSSASILADEMDNLFTGRDINDEMHLFATKFASSMRQFHNQVEPGMGADDMDAPPEEPPKPDDPAAGPATPDGSEAGNADAPDFQRDMGNELDGPQPPLPTPLRFRR